MPLDVEPLMLNVIFDGQCLGPRRPVATVLELTGLNIGEVDTLSGSWILISSRQTVCVERKQLATRPGAPWATGDVTA